MLPPFIIEQIRQREESRKHKNSQPQLELPVPPQRRVIVEKEDDPERGVIIIDLGKSD